MSCMVVCLSWDANYQPPPHRDNDDAPLRLLYTLNQLRSDRESLKTYVNGDRPQHINELYERWQQWLTRVMRWLSMSNLITNDSDPWCIFIDSSEIYHVRSEPWCGMCCMPRRPFYPYRASFNCFTRIVGFLHNPCAPTGLPSQGIF